MKLDAVNLKLPHGRRVFLPVLKSLHEIAYLLLAKIIMVFALKLRLQNKVYDEG